jgi:hypothetical protein
MTPSLVTSLELSKRLKELGVPQDTDFYWCELCPGVIKLFCSLCREHRDFGSYEVVCSAYLAGELGEILPTYFREIFAIQSRRAKHHSETGAEWLCGAQDDGGNWKIKVESHSEAEARGLMLAYLLENNLFTLTK